MGLLGTLDNDPSEKITGTDDDVLGGGYTPLKSDIYTLTIDTAYLEKSAKGALGFHLVATTSGGETYREIIYVTGGDDKGNKNYYIDKKTKEKKYNPNYLQVNSLCLLTVGKELKELTEESKVIKEYDYTARKEVPKKVQMLTELLGENIDAGILHTVKNKNIQVGTDWVPGPEIRSANEIDKFFRTKDHKTTTEILAQVDTATWYQTWLEKFQGKTQDTSVAISGTAGAKPGAPAAKTGAPTSSLFAAKSE